MKSRRLIPIILALSACTNQSTAGIHPGAASDVLRLSTPIQLSGRPPVTMSLAERMKHFKTPGVSIAYFRDGKIVWAKGFGTLSAKQNAPVTSSTQFQAASISKALTAMTVLSLVDEGKLDLDSEIDRYLKDWSPPANPFAPHQAPTLRQVIAHMAGFSVSGFTGYNQGEPLPNSNQILNGEPPANNPKLEITYAPGSQTQYSGGGYVVLEKIVEQVTGLTFERLVRERILDPLSMTRSGYFMMSPAEMQEKFASGHDADGKEYDGGFVVYPESGPAGLWSTPSDLARMAIEVQNELAGRSALVLSQPMANQMLTRQLDNWALGWEFFNATEPAPSFYASGSNRGYKSILYVRRDGSEGVAIMTNSDNGGALFGEILAGMAITQDWQELRPGERKTASLSTEELSSFAGSYEFSEPLDGTLVVKPTADGITIEIPGIAAETAFYPEVEDPLGFFALSGDFARFEADPSGRPIALMIGDVRGLRAED